MALIAEQFGALCGEHGFTECPVCTLTRGSISENDGFREWMNQHESKMEGEDDTDTLMHVAWNAARLRAHAQITTLTAQVEELERGRKLDYAVANKELSRALRAEAELLALNVQIEELKRAT